MANTNFRLESDKSGRHTPILRAGRSEPVAPPPSFVKRPSFWLLAASAGAALTIACLLAAMIPALAEAAGVRLFLLAGLAGLAAAGCAFVAAALQMRAFIAVARALLREREQPMHMEQLSEQQIVELDASLDGLSRALAVENPVRIASGLKMASRALDHQTQAMRQELQRAAETTAAAIDAQTRGFSDRLGEEQARLTQALDLYGETIATRLKLASVGLAREFRDNADQLQQRMQATGDSAVAGLSRQGETLAKALATAVEGVEFRMGDLAGDALTRLAGASDAALERFAASAQALRAEFDSTFAAHVERAEACRRGLLVAIDESGGAMGEWIAQAAQSVETSLQRAVESLDGRVESTLARIESRIDSRVGELEDRLHAVEREAELRGGERREALVSELAAVSHAMQAAVAQATAELGQAARRQTAEIEAAFAGGAQAAAVEWIAQAQSAAMALESASAKALDATSGVETTVSERLAAFEAGVGARATLMVERLTERTEAVAAAVENAGAVVSQRGDHLIESLGAAARDLDGAAATQAGELDARWRQWRAAWEDARQTQAAFWAQHSQEDAARLHDLADTHAGAVAQALDAHRRTVETSFADALAALARDAAAREQDAGAQLGRAAGGFVDGVVSDLAALADVLSARGQSLRGHFAAGQAELVEALTQGLSRAEGQTGERLQAISQTLETLATGIESGLQSRSAAMAEALAEAAQEVERRLTAGTSEALERLAAGRAVLVENIASASRQGADTLEAEAAAAAQRLEDARVALAQTVAQSASGALRELSEAAAAAGDTFAAHSQTARNALLAELAATSERLDAGRAASASAAERASAEFQRQQADLEQTVAGAVARIRDEFGAPLRETLQRVEAESADLAAVTRKLTQSLAEVSTHQRAALHESFAREAQTLANAIAENAENFRSQFETAVAGADDAFLAQGIDLARVLVGRISELRELMSGDGVGLLKELEASSARLAQQVEGASQRALGDFERKATSLITLLTRRGDDLLSAMTASASESARKVGGLSREVEVEAERTASALRETERRIEALLGLVDKRSAEVAALGVRRPPLGQETLFAPRPASPDAESAAPM